MNCCRINADLRSKDMLYRTMKKKIIFVTKALWIGGIETALVNLLKHFDYNKFDVTLLVLKAELDMLDQINPNCKVIIADREKKYTFNEEYRYKKLFHLTEEADNPSKLHKIMMFTVPAIKWIENRLYIKYIRRMMKGQHYDTAVIYSDVVAETAIRAVDSDKYLMYYHHGAMRHVYHDKIAYKRCEKIIAVSNNQADELRKYVPSAKDKIITIHNLTDVEGIREKSFQPIEDVFDSEKYNIVSVGRVSHEKGMDIAVEVCAKLVAAGHKNIQWWIVGDGPAIDEVKGKISDLHMEIYVKCVGMKNNPYPYIRHADLYVQPSRFEGYPMTLLEAQVLGKVIVSTDNNGAKEIIENNVTGKLCETQMSIFSEIIKLIDDNGEYKRIQNRVANLDFEKLNWQCTTHLYEEL